MTLDVNVGTSVSIRSGYTHKKIASGRVTKVCKNWAEIETSYYARPVRFRTNGNLCGVRIIGGMAESLNEYITIE
jgi:hypothetical protein